MLSNTTRSSTAKNTLIQDTFELALAIKTLDIIEDDLNITKVYQTKCGLTL